MSKSIILVVGPHLGWIGLLRHIVPRTFRRSTNSATLHNGTQLMYFDSMEKIHGLIVDDVLVLEGAAPDDVEFALTRVR